MSSVRFLRKLILCYGIVLYCFSKSSFCVFKRPVGLLQNGSSCVPWNLLSIKMWFQYQIGVPVFYWEECLWNTYRFSVFSDFFIRVFSSTPKNKWVFSNRCLFGRKYAKYEWLVQIIECQRFLFDALFLSCNKHRLSMRYGPFQGLKCTISHYDMCIIRPSNGHNQNVKWIFPDYTPRYIAMLYGLRWSIKCRI